MGGGKHMSNERVAATCPNCNSPLQIKQGQDFVKCEYCGTISSAPKAIEYHQHSHVNYDFAGANVQFNAGQDLETLVKNMELHFKQNNTYDARETCRKLIKEYPSDYRGWWWDALFKTKGLTNIDNSARLELSLACKKIQRVATPEQIEKLKEECEEFNGRCRISDLKEQIHNLNGHISDITPEIIQRQEELYSNIRAAKIYKTLAIISICPLIAFTVIGSWAIAAICFIIAVIFGGSYYFTYADHISPSSPFGKKLNAITNEKEALTLELQKANADLRKCEAQYAGLIAKYKSKRDEWRNHLY